MHKADCPQDRRKGQPFRALSLAVAPSGGFFCRVSPPHRPVGSGREEKKKQLLSGSSFWFRVNCFGWGLGIPSGENSSSGASQMGLSWRSGQQVSPQFPQLTIPSAPAFSISALLGPRWIPRALKMPGRALAGSCLAGFHRLPGDVAGMYICPKV